MSLSVSTLALFALLVPGLIFRFSVYEGSQVRRPFFSGNTIYSSIAVLLYSVLIFVTFITLIRIVMWVVNCFSTYAIPLGLAEFNGSLYIFDHAVDAGKTRRYEIVNFLINFPKTAIICFGLICLTAYVAAYFCRLMSTRSILVAKLMYGPLAPLLSKGDTALITCFVLTKVTHENRRLVYAGYPTEICLREGSNIDHIILANPEKFYLRLNRDYPRTSFQKSRPISSHVGESYIFVSGSEIENVHFEAFYFEWSNIKR